MMPITTLPNYIDPELTRTGGGGYHATLMETSQILHLTPELVNMERAHDWENPIDPGIRDVGALLGRDGVRHFAADGTMGSPERATADLGRRALESKARNIAEQVRLIRGHRRRTSETPARVNEKGGL